MLIPPKNYIDKKSMRRSAFYQRFGVRLRERRQFRGMTQGDLARRLGLSRPSVVNMEAGRQTISLDVFVRAANILKADYQEFLP